MKPTQYSTFKTDITKVGLIFAISNFFINKIYQERKSVHGLGAGTDLKSPSKISLPLAWMTGPAKQIPAWYIHFFMIFISKRMDIYGFKLPSLVVLAFEARKSFLLSLFVLLLCHSHPPIKAPARVVYMCSSLLQLTPGSRDLSQAEKRITVL